MPAGRSSFRVDLQAGTATFQMFEGLKPCPHRRVDESGHILCGWIKGGDNQVSVNLCRACPVPQINCEHLRAALEKSTPAPITVRYASGRMEVWNNEAPTVDFQQAACAAKTMPIHSARDCVGCPLRQPHVIPQNAIQVARQNRPAANLTGADPEAAYPPAAVAPSAAPAASQRAAEAAVGYSVSRRDERNSRPLEQSRPVAPPPGPGARSVTAESGPVDEMVRKAKQLAGRKQEERRAAAEADESRRGPRGETRSKIVLLQQWLADQVAKKGKAPVEPPAAEPDEDGVRDIVYTPVAASYQEEPGFERCVGWTD